MKPGPPLVINPYIRGVPVPPKLFYGYTKEIRQFYQALMGPVMQPIRVLGLRRSGKTSFLRYVSSELGRKSNPYLTESGDFTFVYIDLQSIYTPAQFYSHVISAIWKRTSYPDAAIPDEIPNARYFVGWIEKLIDVKENLHLVVLLDEFDTLAAQGEFDPNFFGLLRSMASSSDFATRFTWVTASLQDLHTLSLNQSEMVNISPFWNIFLPTPIILGGFDWDETNNLISSPALSQNVAFSKEEMLEIYRIAGGLPFLIQVVAGEWFEAKLRKKTFKEDVRQTVKKLSDLKQIQKLLAGYWNWMTNEQQVFLHNLANGKVAESFISSQGCSQLHDFGLINNSSKGVEISGELFKQFIVTNKHYIDNHLIEDDQDSETAHPDKAKAMRKTHNTSGKVININIDGNVSESTIITGDKNEVQ